MPTFRAESHRAESFLDVATAEGQHGQRDEETESKKAIPVTHVQRVPVA